MKQGMAEQFNPAAVHRGGTNLDTTAMQFARQRLALCAQVDTLGRNIDYVTNNRPQKKNFDHGPKD